MARKKAARRPTTARARRKAAAAQSRKAARPAKRAGKPARKASTRRPAASTRKAAASRRRSKPSPRKRVAKSAVRKSAVRKSAARKRTVRKARRTVSAKAAGRRAASAAPASGAQTRKPRIDRERRILREEHGVPSSLDLDRRGSSARTGRDEFRENRRDHASMSPAITAGDLDANLENAYFSGEEAPGGDNPTPDQDVVEEIGQALGIQYQDNEELQGGDEVAKRDKHRWEFDPASSEDYRDRKNEER